MKKILHLTLKKKWFYLILKGEKKHEYRIAKAYWVRRLTEEFDLRNGTIRFRHFDEIIFRNGYSKTAPTIRIGFLGIRYLLSRHSFNESLAPTISEPFFEIQLGKILGTKNIKSAPKAVANTAPNNGSTQAVEK
jgi:hypothetical protein